MPRWPHPYVCKEFCFVTQLKQYSACLDDHTFIFKCEVMCDVLLHNGVNLTSVSRWPHPRPTTYSYDRILVFASWWSHFCDFFSGWFIIHHSGIWYVFIFKLFFYKSLFFVLWKLYRLINWTIVARGTYRRAEKTVLQLLNIPCWQCEN